MLSGFIAYTKMFGDDDTSLLVADRKFAVEEKKIGKIFIADRRGNTTTLEKVNGTWLLEGKERVRQNAMANLLDAVTRIQVEYKPPQAAEEHMIKDLAANGIKVEIYDSKEKLLKAYYVGGSTQDERGTFAIMEGSENPYVTHIPNWSGNLRFRYNLTGDDWRDKTLLNHEEADIARITIEYPKQQDKSFKLTKSGRNIEVQPFYDITPSINRPFNQASLQAYVLKFEKVVAEAFENDNPVKDSIRNNLPFSIITVEDQDGRSTKLELFPIFPKNTATDPKTGMPLVNDAVERYFVNRNDKDFMLAQHRLVREVLWAYESFFK